MVIHSTIQFSFPFALILTLPIPLLLFPNICQLFRGPIHKRPPPTNPFLSFHSFPNPLFLLRSLTSLTLILSGLNPSQLSFPSLQTRIPPTRPLTPRLTLTFNAFYSPFVPSFLLPHASHLKLQPLDSFPEAHSLSLPPVPLSSHLTPSPPPCLAPSSQRLTNSSTPTPFPLLLDSADNSADTYCQLPKLGTCLSNFINFQ